MVGLVAYGEIHPGFFVYDAPCMAEFQEPVFAVVASHAAFSYAAKGHCACGKVYDSVIDASAAETAA